MSWFRAAWFVSLTTKSCLTTKLCNNAPSNNVVPQRTGPRNPQQSGFRCDANGHQRLMPNCNRESVLVPVGASFCRACRRCGFCRRHGLAGRPCLAAMSDRAGHHDGSSPSGTKCSISSKRRTILLSEFRAQGEIRNKTVTAAKQTPATVNMLIVRFGFHMKALRVFVAMLSPSRRSSSVRAQGRRAGRG